MSNFIFSLNIVLPLFLIMALGFFIKICGIVDDAALRILNRLCFRVLLPILLFYNIYMTDLNGMINPKLLVFSALSILSAFALFAVITMIVEKDNAKRGPLIQGIGRSNFIIFGMPISLAMFGPEKAGITAMIVAVVVPIFNIVSVVVLSIFREKKMVVKDMIVDIITNPMIIACFLGFIFLKLQIKLPVAIEKTASDIAKSATPLAIMALGGSFSFSSVKGNLLRILYGVTSKLVIIPAIFIPISIRLGFTGPELVALVTVFAAPTAVSSFTMAQQMEADHVLAGQLVVFSSSLSVFTIFLWIFGLKSLGYL